MAGLAPVLKYNKRQVAIAACLLFLLALWNWAATAQTLPKRVVSLNLCTDILALSLADMDQMLSVSSIASDPVSSPVADIAASYHHNHARLEEILALKPDLVLASVYTSPDKISVLEKAGLRVERFGSAQNFADIRQHIKQMGEALGQEHKADAQIKQIDTTLAGLQQSPKPLTAIVYEPNGLTSGVGSLADETMRLLGITNMAAKNNQFAAGRIGLEALVQLHPDLIVTPELYVKPALAYQNYKHPVMEALVDTNGKKLRQIAVPMRYWSCGSIYSIEAAKILSAAVSGYGDQ